MEVKPLARQIKCQLFVAYVATNMMVCALVFAPWALPRETVSGLLGRWKCGHRGFKHSFGKAAAVVVDLIYFWEPDHCRQVFLCEAEARKVLYPEHPGAVP